MTPGPDTLKSCCAAAYESDFARALLGDSFHPGGLKLTRRLGERLEIARGMRILDVASGKGESAIFLAKHFGCEVVGIDLGAANVTESARRAEAAGVGELVAFRHGDAESVTFPAGSFDRVICECAFCTFPNKHAAACEFRRALRPGGRVGLSDLTRAGPVPQALQGLLAWVACIADAQPLDEYARYLTEAGLKVDLIEPHDDALGSLVQEIRAKLLGAELLVKLKKIDLPTADFDQAKALARAAAEAVKAGTFGYALLTAACP